MRCLLRMRWLRRGFLDAVGRGRGGILTGGLRIRGVVRGDRYGRVPMVGGLLVKYLGIDHNEFLVLDW